MNNGSSKSPLFLMEISIAILFFFLGCSVCLEGFAKANTLSNQSENLLGALRQIENLTAYIQTDEDAFSILESRLEAAPPTGGWTEHFPTEDLLLYYAEDWQRTTPELAAFAVAITKSASPQSRYLIQVCTPDGAVVLKQEIFVHLPVALPGEVHP